MAFQLDTNLKLAKCPNCKVVNPLLTFKTVFPFRKMVGQREHWYGWIQYQCSRCGAPTSVQTAGSQSAVAQNPPAFREIKPTGWVIPSSIDVDESVPPVARNYLAQALDSAHAPDGAVMLANSAIDAMLQARGLEEGSVHKRLKEAVEKGLLTEEIREWADIVRDESNNPRHADKGSPHVSPERARLMVEFTAQLARVLFVLPAQAQNAKLALNSDGGQESDDESVT